MRVWVGWGAVISVLGALSLACGGGLGPEATERDALSGSAPASAVSSIAAPPSGYEVVADLPDAVMPGLRIVQGERDVAVVDGTGALVASGFDAIDYSALPVLAEAQDSDEILRIAADGRRHPCVAGVSRPAVGRVDGLWWVVDDALAERDALGVPSSHFMLMGAECEVIATYEDRLEWVNGFHQGWARVGPSQPDGPNWAREDGTLRSFPANEPPAELPPHSRRQFVVPRRR